MHWFLVGCCGLALVNLSVARIHTLQVTQMPRFFGVKTNQSVAIYCEASEPNLQAQVQWYKASEYNEMSAKRTPVLDSERVETKTRRASIYLRHLGTEDSGVYYCKVNSTWGPGTEVQVFRPINMDIAVYSKLKDALIFLQGLLLAMCIAAPLIWNHRLLKKEETIYEEPERDHIYQGLEIETCGGGLYEDISVYAQPEEPEASWEQN